MLLRLDPRLPLVWRSPSSLQLGVDAPRVVLDDVTGPQERLIAALVTGVSRSGLDVIAHAAGAAPAETEQLLGTLRPALARRPSRAPALARRPTRAPAGSDVVIAGRGPTADLLAGALRSAGLTVIAAGVDRGTAVRDADLAIVVAHFVVDPDYSGMWLRRDRVHLPIVLGDSSARIGPFVEPGIGPCLYCLERRRTDEDAAWPAIASQLWGRRSTLDSALVAGEVAARAARLVLARLDRGRAGAAASVTLDASTGLTTTRTWQRHPECGCSVLPGSVTAPSPPTDSEPSAPNSVVAAGGPG